MSQHTAGDWEAVYDRVEREWYVSVKEDGKAEVIVAVCGGGETSEADARLIAAAKGLLEALKNFTGDHAAEKAFRKDCDLDASPIPCGCHLCDAASAAFAKAEGS